MNKKIVMLIIFAAFTLALVTAAMAYIPHEEISKIKPLLTTVDLLSRMLIGTPVPFVGQ